MPTAKSTDICYRINARDELIGVDGDWTDFAVQNDGGDVVGDHVLGRSLWGFIEDESTRRLYRQILKTVRRGKSITFPFRCDSPSQRRHLEMTVSSNPMNPGEVEFCSRVVSLEEREAIPLLARDTPRSGELIRSCAWCNRFGVGEHDWVEIEEAIDRLHLFSKTVLPGITHGICPACSHLMKSRIEEMNRHSS